MGVREVTEAGRLAAERLMLDTVLVVRLSDGPDDPLTGAPTKAETVLYAGKAKRQTYEAYEENPVAGGHKFVVQRYQAHFPIDAFNPRPGDVIRWVASALNPILPGTVDRIPASFKKSFGTAMRLNVDEVVF